MTGRAPGISLPAKQTGAAGLLQVLTTHRQAGLQAASTGVMTTEHIPDTLSLTTDSTTAGMILTAVVAIEIMSQIGAMITADQPPGTIIENVTTTDTGMMTTEATAEAMTRHLTAEEEPVAAAPAQAPAPAELLLLAESSTGPGDMTMAGIDNHSQQLHTEIGQAVETIDSETLGVQMTGLEPLKLTEIKTGIAEDMLFCTCHAHAETAWPQSIRNSLQLHYTGKALQSVQPSMISTALQRQYRQMTGSYHGSW